MSACYVNRLGRRLSNLVGLHSKKDQFTFKDTRPHFRTGNWPPDDIEGYRSRLYKRRTWVVGHGAYQNVTISRQLR